MSRTLIPAAVRIDQAVAEPARERDILARTLWGEARSEGEAGMRAVAAVIINRRARDGIERIRSVREICLAAYQFSCWNVGDPNRIKVLTVDESDAAFRLALTIAAEALSGTMVDPTSGATHYHAAHIRPYWSRDRLPSARIGRHVFYNNVE